jgi:hypothetical protein
VKRKRPTRRPAPDLDFDIALRLLHEDVLHIEALAITADEAAIMLPPRPPAEHKRILARLISLVSQTAGQATAALERSEELIARLAAQLQAGKRAPARRMR